jgi:CheY-like chemotaxis protein
LCLGGSAAQAEKILEELRAAGMAIEPKVVTTRDEYLEAVSAQEFSIILSADALVEWSGTEAREALRQSGKSTPFILLTEKSGNEYAGDTIARDLLSCGEEAKRLCEEETPALAILDLVMPRLGGAATAAELQNRFPALPVLFTSGYMESTETTASQFPNSYYLQKPYRPTSLARVVRKILSPAGTADLAHPAATVNQQNFN